MGLLWGVVALYLCFAAGAVRRHHREQLVERVEIRLADSTANGYLVSNAMVQGWIRESRIPTIGEPLGTLQLDSLERTIRRCGFVDRVRAYATYDGVLKIDIWQRRPVLRLRIDGFNHYLTADGYLFEAPALTSLYLPVVTGSYRLPVPAGYTGAVNDELEAARRACEARLLELEQERYQCSEARKEVREAFAEKKAFRRKLSKKRMLESDDRYRDRLAEVAAMRREAEREERYRLRMIEQREAAIAARRAAELHAQKKLEKYFADLGKLITFVEFVEADEFWRSEIVQIVASASASGALEVALIPRSGRHTIRFGQPVDVERKFGKLMRFYRNGLSRIGWDRYSVIDVAYEGQVVCR